MHMPKIIFTLITVVMILSSTFTSAGANPPAGEGIGTDIVWTDPEPYYPVEETIFDKTPEFRFSQYNGVTKYRIKVRNYEDQDIEYYTYKGTATCNTECRMTPDIPLSGGVITYGTESKGYYEWTVEAKLAPGVWSGIQAYVPFGLGTTGFNSQFTSDKKNWQDINGEWTLTSAGYLKDTGIPGQYTSTLFKKRIYDNFTYQVRMKLKSDDPDKHFGGLIISGYPDPVDPAQGNTWYNGFYVVYKNAQKAGIFIWTDGTLIGGTGWQDCSFIKPNDWNTIKVVVTGLNMEVFINGSSWQSLNSHSLDRINFIGLTQYRGSTNAEKMSVDWAKLEVDTP